MKFIIKTSGNLPFTCKSYLDAVVIQQNAIPRWQSFITRAKEGDIRTAIKTGRLANAFSGAIGVLAQAARSPFITTHKHRHLKASKMYCIGLI